MTAVIMDHTDKVVAKYNKEAQHGITVEAKRSVNLIIILYLRESIHIWSFNLSGVLT